MSDREDEALLKTKPLSSDVLQAIKKARASEPKYSLILYHRAGSDAITLAREASLVIGRDAPADVVIADENLSRMHARVRVDGEEVIVEDLGSTNGTRVNGEPITSRKVKPGDEIDFGAVTASIHLVTKGESNGFGLIGHDRFCALLEEDVVRAKYFSRSFALIMVRSSREKDTHDSHWYERVRALLRPVDRAALYAPGFVEILVPECTADDAAKLARSIAGGRASNEPVLSCGVAMFPGSGASADALLEASREASYRATQPHTIEVPKKRAAIIVSSAMKSVYETIDRIARSTIPILITGETGTGKELVARSIHEQGPRKNMSLASVNCGAIPANLVEGALFGHEKGAFTGADREQKGIFEAAHGGTVFLDEIGELPPGAQAALLRVLETKRITRIGSTKELDVDVRVLAATHRDLNAMIAAGTFRSDLFYRLNVMTLALPPLRERTEEIAPLVERFIESANAANGTRVLGIDEDALAALLAYKWPGNVRELKNAIDRAVVLARGETITLPDLPEGVRAARGAVEVGDGAYKAKLQQADAAIIVEALKRTAWNQTEAAKALDMPLRTLVHKIKALGIKKSA